MLKKFFCLFIALITLFLCGCHNENKYPEDDVLGLFMNALKNGNYAEAYSFLSSKCIPPEDERDDKEKTANTVSLGEFAEIYRDVFNTIGLESLEYSVISEKETAGGRIIEYSLKYGASETGTLEYDFTMKLRNEDDTLKILWAPSLIFPDMTYGDSVLRAALRAKRGDITADGRAVAMNVNLVTVYAAPADIIDRETLTARIAAAEGLEKEAAKNRVNAYLNDMTLFKTVCESELNTLYSSLSELLNIDRKILFNAFDRVFGGSIIIKQFYPDEISPDTCRALEALGGVHVDLENFGTGRYYPYGKLLAHSVGYLGTATPEEIKKYNEGRKKRDGLYNTDSLVGKTGLEKLYEKELRGKDGYYFFIRGADGANKKTLYRKNAENGSDVNISIDLKTQRRAEELLDTVLFGNDTAGAVIVMNPKTGAVQAMASNPAFDLNAMTRGLTPEEYENLTNMPNKPMFNRAISGRYPPGSTFKAFTAAAALDSGVMNEDYVFKGKIKNDYWKPADYGKWVWPPIKRSRAFNRLEPLNMMNCMVQSDNIYFANAALKTGADKFIKYMSNLGMDSPLPFELGAGRSKILNESSVMDYKLLADSGYGQGNLLVSPLQLADMYCAFANEGNIPVPYIVESLSTGYPAATEYSFKHTPEAWRKNVIKPYTVSRINAMLREVVNPDNFGTGRSLRVKNCAVAGKTGTAEIGSDKERVISWFAGFRLDVPETDERLVLVMLEVPNTDAHTSLKFQIARSLLEIYDEVDINEP